MQLAAARLGRPWHDLFFASAHGLDTDGVVAAAAEHPRVLALSDAAHAPQALAAALVAAALPARVTVLERLGEPGERVTTGDAATIAGGRLTASPSAFHRTRGAGMTAHDRGSDRARGAVPPGLPDELFTRGDAPMTKAEVRAVTMSAARLLPDDRVMDVGAGTGSMTVEAALLCPDGEVVAVERDAAALDVLRLNVERFELGNVTVVEGPAPDVFATSPVFDRASFDCVLVGGSGGKLGVILETLQDLLRPGGRVVCNTICLETTTTVTAALRRPPWTGFTCSQVSVARGVPAGPLLRFEGLNPVWVTTATLGDES